MSTPDHQRECILPLSTEEPLWEWDTVTDNLYLTNGARRMLKLSEPPRTMSDFYALLPSETAFELSCIHKNALSEGATPPAECAYLFNELWVREHMLIISRDMDGRATRAMGQLMPSPLLETSQELITNAGIYATTGMWLYDVPNRRVWHDKICISLLGSPGAPHAPLPIDDEMRTIHPADRMALKRHYKLFCESSQLGETITDIIRIANAHGGYSTYLVRASALSRDARGKAILLAGMLSMRNQSSAAHNSLAKDNKLFHALNSMGGGQWNWDTNMNEFYFCPRYLSMLGYDSAEGHMFSWKDAVHPDDQAKVNAARKAIIESPHKGESYECTYRMKGADGQWAWIFDRGYVTWRDEAGRAGHMIGAIINITTAQAEREKLEELVRHDALTGLRSRAFFDLEIEHIERNAIRPVSVIAADITGLKIVNDAFGHRAGDELLTTSARLLKEALRANDCVARTGGDEFMALLANCSSEKGKYILEKIEKRFREYNAGGAHMPVFAAFGVATAETAATSLHDVIVHADEAMYRHKKESRKETQGVLKKWVEARTGKRIGEDDRLSDV